MPQKTKHRIDTEVKRSCSISLKRSFHGCDFENILSMMNSKEIIIRNLRDNQKLDTKPLYLRKMSEFLVKHMSEQF